MLYKNFIVSLLLANFLVSSGCSGESSTCKVENTGGAPRISVDGKPVRARMLYVSPTYFMLGTPTKRKAYKYMNSWVDTFVEIPKLSRPLKNGEIRIDGPLGPLEYRISDLHIVDSETGEKVYNFDIKNRDSRVYVISEGKSSFSFSKAPDGTDFLKVESLSNKKSSIIFCSRIYQ